MKPFLHSLGVLLLGLAVAGCDEANESELEPAPPSAPPADSPSTAPGMMPPADSPSTAPGTMPPAQSPGTAPGTAPPLENFDAAPAPTPGQPETPAAVADEEPSTGLPDPFMERPADGTSGFGEQPGAPSLDLSEPPMDGQAGAEGDGTSPAPDASSTPTVTEEPVSDLPDD